MTEDNYNEVQRSLSMLGQEVERLLKVLTEDESMVIKMRFGLDGGEEKSAHEVAIAIGRSVEEILELEQTAMKKLSDPAN